jgi:translation initiation factor IF-2
LAENDVEIEDYGGETQVVAVSGKTGQGMAELEEAIITLSEILDHRSPTTGKAEGWVIEASTKIYGRVATVLVRRGILRPGSVIVAGRAWGKVKTLRNEFDELVDEAGPGTPVEIDGWRIPPTPGDQVLQAEDEQQATAVVKTRDDLADQLRIAQDIEVINATRKEQRALATDSQEKTEKKPWCIKQADPNHVNRIIEGNFVDKLKTSGIQEVILVIKADVIGSAEAIVNLISGLGNNEVRPNVIRAGAGAVYESDIELAASTGASVIAFNTEVDANARAFANEAGVDIIEESIIYRVSEAVIARLEQLLPPKVVQRVTGEAEIAATFSYKIKGSNIKIAGCKVRNGSVAKGNRVRILRKNEKIFDGDYNNFFGDDTELTPSIGSLVSLKNVKKDVQEMRKDTECGMNFGEWEDFEIGDVVQCYTEIKEARSLQ